MREIRSLKSRQPRLFLACHLLLVVALPLKASEAAPSQGRSAAEVLLVYNARSPVSKSVADDYAVKRKVQNVVAVRCVDSSLNAENETVSFAVYSESIETPVRDYLAAHREIHFVVLAKGIPLRILGAETGERDEHSSPDMPLRASVDSHLASLGYAQLRGAKKMSITGSGGTGVGWVNRYWNAKEPFSHEKFGGYLVTRLDGYTEADAKSLVARALAAERKGVVDGSVLLDVQPIFGLGDPKDAPARVEGDVIKE